jgi:hypothetical protein
LTAHIIRTSAMAAGTTLVLAALVAVPSAVRGDSANRHEGSRSSLPNMLPLPNAKGFIATYNAGGVSIDLAGPFFQSLGGNQLAFSDSLRNLFCVVNGVTTLLNPAISFLKPFEKSHSFKKEIMLRPTQVGAGVWENHFSRRTSDRSSKPSRIAALALDQHERTHSSDSSMLSTGT